ncbi:hypothetical protein TNCT_461071 [Trichonephila clavata]|uniref:Uncharacterized protein n=1 Tax=Trichonephila clavata TaxID=2740835 RepID=A0A8X6KMW7_TRICU|nr:hypothetical protein TNCT_461071 [Trichonephila clavata]
MVNGKSGTGSSGKVNGEAGLVVFGVTNRLITRVVSSCPLVAPPTWTGLPFSSGIWTMATSTGTIGVIGTAASEPGRKTVSGLSEKGKLLVEVESFRSSRISPRYSTLNRFLKVLLRFIPVHHNRSNIG